MPAQFFDPATRVLMADGSSRPIDDVNVGDQVVATDPVSGESTARPVIQLHRNVDHDLTDVTVRDAGSGRSTVLKTTQHHPFWDATDRRRVDAKDLKSGHRLLVHDDKRLEGDSTGAGMGGGGPGHAVTVTVTEVRNHAGTKEMRDLTVATIHTYHVVAGNEPVLVHNCGDLEKDYGVAGGHAKDHTGLTDDDIIHRAKNDPKANGRASRLFDETAQDDINATLAGIDLDGWATKNPQGARRSATKKFNRPVGRYADDQGNVRDAYNLQLEIRRIGKKQDGHKGAPWIVYTVTAF